MLRWFRRREKSRNLQDPNRALADAERELEEAKAKDTEINELVQSVREIRMKDNFVQMIKGATNPHGIVAQRKA
jgi:hypothetical protein